MFLLFSFLQFRQLLRYRFPSLFRLFLLFPVSHPANGVTSAPARPDLRRESDRNERRPARILAADSHSAVRNAPAAHALTSALRHARAQMNGCAHIHPSAHSHRHTHIHIRTHTHIHIRTDTHTHAYSHRHMHIRTDIHIHTDTHTCTFAQTHTYTHSHRHTHIHIRTDKHTYANRLTLTHAHIFLSLRQLQEEC